MSGTSWVCLCQPMPGQPFQHSITCPGYRPPSGLVNAKPAPVAKPMPTNDPTAPRVVGGGERTCQCSCHAGGGAGNCRSCRMAHPAVLPEEGTTPPSYDVGGLEAEPGFHEPFEKSLARGQLHAGSLRETGLQGPSFGGTTNAAAPALRETGAGRGEADPDGQPSMTDAEMADYWCKVANEQDERIAELEAELRAAHVKVEALDVALRANAAEVANLREQSAAASLEGGAPTEELTEDELQMADDFMGDEWSDGSYEQEQQRAIGKLLAFYRASRLTRSPRAAGEPTGCTGIGMGGTGMAEKPACSRCGGSGVVQIACPGPAAPPPERAP